MASDFPNRGTIPKETGSFITSEGRLFPDPPNDPFFDIDTYYEHHHFYKTLQIPHRATINSMTIRGRVPHYQTCFHVFITKVPNGSHPNEYLSQQYYLDERLCEVNLGPSYNNGYIHHANSIKNLDLKIDLVKNTYMIDILMTFLHRFRKVGNYHNRMDGGYLTDIEIRYTEPEPLPAGQQLSVQPLDPLIPQTQLTNQAALGARIDHRVILDKYFKYLREPYYIDEIKQKLMTNQRINEKEIQNKILHTEKRLVSISEIKKLINKLK